MKNRINEKVQATLEAYGAPGLSVAVVEGGRLVFAKGFGKANIAKAQAVDTKTRYAVGSISKQFTAAAILLEQEKGRLSLG